VAARVPHIEEGTVADDVEKKADPGIGASAAGAWRHGRLLPTNRLEAFSDGVFAIAITLLVLELKVPDLELPGESSRFLHELGLEWHTYLAYLVSFAFIGGSWIAHANLSRFIKAADAAMMRLNLALLLFVSLLPFTTSLMASDLEGDAKHVVVFIFGLNLTLAALMVNMMIRHAVRTPGIADDEVAEHELRGFAKERVVGLAVMAVATIVGLLLPKVGIVVYLIVSVVFLVEPLARSSWRRRQGV
jgi:uncharacterized membrane protein